MSTDQRTQHLLRENEQIFTDKPIIEKNSFSKFFDEMLKRLNETIGEKISKKDIANKLGISSEMFRKIVNKEKPTHNRDCIIAICAMLHADTTDTNMALYFYNMSELNDYISRDELMMNILDEQSENQLTISEINEKLKVKKFPELDIINHRAKKNNDETIYPYTRVKTKVECRMEDLTFDDIYDSLDAKYNRLYRIMAFMWLEDSGKRGYKLCAEPDGYLSCTEYPMVGKWYHEYDTIDDTGIFKSCFEELQKMARIEQRKMADMINDTRNYHERISAKIIKNELHVFYETYNYTIPELGEYYLMDYVNGEYTLYVSYDSRFMKYYLSDNEYRELFGKLSDKVEEAYCSVKDIEHAIEISKPDRKDIIKLRISTFRNAKGKIVSLIDDLKAGKAHIRNFERIYDNPYDVLKRYQVTKEFMCTFDSEYGEIVDIGVEKVVFTLSDGRHIKLTFDDLCAGFRLGLSSIDEIGSFLLEHHTFEITELL